MTERQEEHGLNQMVDQAVDHLWDEVSTANRRRSEPGTHIFDLGTYSLLLPVACDAGLFLEPDDGILYVFDLNGDMPTQRYDLNDPDIQDEALQQLRDLLHEQINNASSGQLRHYAAWVDSMINRE